MKTKLFEIMMRTPDGAIPPEIERPTEDGDDGGDKK